MSMAALQHLAIDLGAESGRVMSVRFDGERLQLAEVHRFANQPVRVRNSLRWNVLSLWDEMLSGLRKAFAQHGAAASVGVDTWGVDFALLDAAGELLGAPFHYRDARTDGMLEAAFCRVPRAYIFERTGIQFMQLNTLYQLLAMALQRAPALEHARHLLMMPDLFHFWLSGSIACEFTDATTTQCYDPRAGDWARDLLAELGIPTHFFTRIVPPGTALGTLAADVARTLGDQPWRRTQVIAPAAHDTASAVAAVPAKPGERFAYISSGTWSLMGAVVRAPVISPQALEFNFTNEGGVEGTFRLLKNIMGMWLVQECRRAWASPSGSLIPYAELFAMAERAAPFTFMIDPDDPSFLHPDDMPEAIRAFCRRSGQPEPTDRATIVRGIVESLALKYHATLRQLEALLGHTIEVIYVVGGGAQNALLCQFTADACGVPVLAGPIEATALGNALTQMVTLGEAGSLQEARAVVRRSFALQEYLPRNPEQWDEAHARFQKLLTSDH